MSNKGVFDLLPFALVESYGFDKLNARIGIVNIRPVLVNERKLCLCSRFIGGRPNRQGILLPDGEHILIHYKEIAVGRIGAYSVH